MPAVVSTIDIWFEKLGIAFHDVQKSFSVFGFEVFFYGVVIAVSVLAGLFVATRVAKKTGQDPENYLELVIFCIIFGVIGARLYYVIFAWDDFKNDLLQVFNIRGGGLAIYGAVIGGVLTAVVYCRKKKLNTLLVLDTACCGLITGQMLGRWSNFINMEAFGSYTDGFTAMRLNAAKLTAPMLSGYTGPMITVDGVDYIQVHPTFLYESLWSMMVLIILLIFTKRKKFNGQIFLMYLIGYGLGRFWIEGLRTDQLKIGHTNIAVSQVLSGAIVIAGIAVFIVMLRKSKMKAALTGEAAAAEEGTVPAAEAAEEATAPAAEAETATAEPAADVNPEVTAEPAPKPPAAAPAPSDNTPPEP